MAIPTFTWAAGGVPVTPEQAKRQRAVAEALIGRSATPAANWGQGLADLAAAYTGTVLDDRAAEAEEAGALEASGLFQGLTSDSPEADIIAALSNEWTSPAQSSVAQALLGQQFQENDPYRQIQIAQAQLNYDQDLAGADASVDAPASVREWEYFNGLEPDQQSQYLRMKRANPYLDLGPEFVAPDPANPGQTLGGPIVKDNFTPAYDAAEGTAQAKVDVETQAAADSLSSKMPGLRTVVGELSDLAKTATYTQTGQIIDNTMRELGQEPSESAVARTKYIAMVDNQVLPLLRDTFGAAFTVKEGETLRATLGDPNKSPVEKQAILEAFIEQKARDLEALQSRLPEGATPPAPTTTYTFNPSTGLLE